jgi:excinuclease ABC subunit C
LVLIDGGKGHLSVAVQVMLELGLDDIPVASIAKENEELYTPQIKDPILLSKSSQALYLIQRVRDEAHRFAITFHRSKRSKSMLSSRLDSIVGIGPSKKMHLMNKFGSLKGIAKAGVQELATIPGISTELAIVIKQSI